MKLAEIFGAVVVVIIIVSIFQGQAVPAILAIFFSYIMKDDIAKHDRRHR